MDYGFFGFNVGGLSTPDSMERVVVTAEQLGFESVWTAEHVVLIDPQQDPSPIPAESNTVDTIASLAFAAAKTKRIKLGTGILLLPQRDPIVLAKELAGVDVLSKGRLLFGLGVGYVPGEFEALGIPWKERGARTTEHIDVLRTLWTQENPSFDGKFTKFSGKRPGATACFRDCSHHNSAITSNNNTSIMFASLTPPTDLIAKCFKFLHVYVLGQNELIPTALSYYKASIMGSMSGP